jgi:hypothetical protein
MLLGGRDERSLDAFEDDILIDVFVSVNRIDDSQDFLGIHGNLSTVYSPAARQNELFELFKLSSFRSTK